MQSICIHIAKSSMIVGVLNSSPKAIDVNIHIVWVFVFMIINEKLHFLEFGNETILIWILNGVIILKISMMNSNLAWIRDTKASDEKALIFPAIV